MMIATLADRFFIIAMMVNIMQTTIDMSLYSTIINLDDKDYN